MHKLFVNSLFVFVACFWITTTIHELGHYLVYLFLQASPVLFHNHVESAAEGLSVYQRTAAALGGPLISFAQGLICFILIRIIPKSALRLTVLWLSIFGFINFFGYVMLTPLTTTGDTGFAAEIMGVPNAVRMAIGLLGIVLLIFIIRAVAKHFSDFIPARTEISNKKRAITSLIVLPIIFGSLFNAALSFPVVAALSVIYPATSSFVVMSAYGVILGETSGGAGDIDSITSKIHIPLFVLCMAMIILNRLLTMGF
jgi:hypothetical protein